jgi:diguanylate cyclase (GGDEF)-like protein
MIVPNSPPAATLQWRHSLRLGAMCLVIAIPIIGAMMLRLHDGREAARLIDGERIGLRCTLAAERLLIAIERLRIPLDATAPVRRAARATNDLRDAIAELGRRPCGPLAAGPRMPLRVFAARAQALLHPANPDVAARTTIRLGTDALGIVTDIGDASGLTYDPTVDAVNLDDAIVARIPGFTERLDQSAEVLRLGRHQGHITRGSVVAVEKLAGEALEMEAMANDDFDGAALALPDLGPTLAAARARTRVAGDALGHAIDLDAELPRGARPDPRLAALRSAAIEAVQGLMTASVQVLERSFDTRLAALRRSERATLATGGGALFVDCLIVLALWRATRRRDEAELERARERAVMLETELARASAERDLSLTQQQFRAVFDGSDVGIAVVDAGGERLEANAALRRMFDDDLSQVTREIGALFARVRNTRSHAARHEYCFERLDGAPLWIELSLSLVRGAPNEAVSSIVLVHDITSHKMLTARLDHETNHDALTGLSNRVAFMRRIEALIAGRTEPFAVAFIDLDHFKAVNDTLGHHAGDAALRTVAQRLTSVVRPNDLVARLHGDEFAAILTDVGDGSAWAVDSVVARIGAALVFTVEGPGTSVGLSASIGYVRDGRSYSDASALLHDADSAMYRSKVGGRNLVSAFEDLKAAT